MIIGVLTTIMMLLLPATTGMVTNKTITEENTQLTDFSDEIPIVVTVSVNEKKDSSNMIHWDIIVAITNPTETPATIDMRGGSFYFDIYNGLKEKVHHVDTGVYIGEITMNPGGLISKTISWKGVDGFGNYLPEGTYTVYGYTDSVWYNGQKYTINKEQPFNMPWRSKQPYKPSLSCNAKGRIDEEFTLEITPTDPESDRIIQAEINWGDGKTEIMQPLVETWLSGETQEFTHTWSKTGTFKIEARVMDENNIWSEWSQKHVQMPKQKIKNTMLTQLLEQFPMLARLLTL